MEHRLEQPEAESTPDHCRRHQDLPGGVAQPVEPAIENQPDAFGDVGFADLQIVAKFTGRVKNPVLLNQMLVKLLDEKGIALGFVENQPDQLRRRLPPAKRAKHLRHALVRKTLKLDGAEPIADQFSRVLTSAGLNSSSVSR